MNVLSLSEEELMGKLSLFPVALTLNSIICAARDVKFAQKVAIKKIPNAFDRASEATRILREVKLLRHFRVWIWEEK